MPKKNNQEQIPLIEQTGQRSSYHSTHLTNSTTPSENHPSNKPYDPASLFFTQKFKKDFPVDDFNRNLSLNIFKFYES